MQTKGVGGRILGRESGGSSAGETVGAEQKQNMFLMSRLRHVSTKGVRFQEALLVARLPMCP